jgi:hypothetical protein
MRKLVTLYCDHALKAAVALFTDKRRKAFAETARTSE